MQSVLVINLITIKEDEKRKKKMRSKLHFIEKEPVVSSFSSKKMEERETVGKRKRRNEKFIPFVYYCFISNIRGDCFNRE